MKTCASSPEQDLLPMELPSMSSAAGSHARTCLSPAEVGGLPASAPAYGRSLQDSFANYDHNSRSWRTSSACWIEGWMPFSETWPRSGSMRTGIAYRRPTLAPVISETGSGLLPTPCATDFKDRFTWPTILRRASQSSRGVRLGETMARLTGKVGRANPPFWEWMMMFPSGWTACGPSETPSRPRSQNSSAKQS